MRNLLLIILTVCSHQIFASVCGEAIDFSTDHDGFITGFTVNNESQQYRITPKNSPELHNSIDLSKGYFVCLDKFETYTRKVRNKDEVRSYAKTTEWRLWLKGRLIAALPLKSESKVKLIEEAADIFGEYLDVPQFGKFELKYLSKKENPHELSKLGSQIINRENELMGERGSVYRVAYYAILLRKTQEIVGYVISTDEVWESNSLHDGSGTHFYIDIDYNQLFDISWAG